MSNDGINRKIEVSLVELKGNIFICIYIYKYPTLQGYIQAINFLFKLPLVDALNRNRI